MENHDELFLWLSIHLTGFDRAELEGTGMVAEYCRYVAERIGRDEADPFWEIVTKLRPKRPPRNADALNKAIRQQLIDDHAWGPVARNIIRLWYTGTWRQSDKDPTSEVIISPQAYKEGLVWRAISSHPAGARQPGFGTWADEPVAN